MANTYTSLHFHIVFSTKNREPWITPDIEQRIWEYLGGIARQNDMKALKVGGIQDHVHVVLGLRASMAVSQAVQLLKGNASKWIHEDVPVDGRICLAGRIRRLHGEPITIAEGNPVCGESTRTSSGAHISGRIQTALGKAPD
jgi:REP element-mobilizing transposase RayT